MHGYTVSNRVLMISFQHSNPIDARIVLDAKGLDRGKKQDARYLEIDGWKEEKGRERKETIEERCLRRIDGWKGGEN